MEAKDHNYGVAEDEVAQEQGPVAHCGVPGFTVDVVSGDLARDPGRGVDHNDAADARLDRVPTRPCDGPDLTGSLRAQRVCGLPGEQGRRVPLPPDRRHDRSPLDDTTENLRPRSGWVGGAAPGGFLIPTLHHLPLSYVYV